MTARQREPMASVTGKSIVGPSPARDMYAQRIGSALTPARIARVMALADIGYIAEWHDLLNEVRQKDAALHSVLQTREQGLLSRGWDVTPWKADGAEEAEAGDEEIAGFVRSALRGTAGFDRALAHLLDANYKAFSVCEVLWKKEAGQLTLDRLVPVQGRRWFVREDMSLVWYDDGEKPDKPDVIAGNAGRFVVHKPRINGDTLAREGLGRALIWYSAFGTWAWRDWMLFAELFGKPQRHVEYDPEHYQTDTDGSVKEALNNLIASGYAIFPNGAKLITEWPAGGKGDASPSPAIIDKALDWMALATLGQRATTSTVQNGLGGRGDVRDLVRKDILKGDDVALSETIREQVIAPLVRLNFGPTANVPRFGFDVEDGADVKAFAEGLAPLVDRGLRVPAGYVHKTLGIPEVVDDEPTLSPATKAPSPSQDGPKDAAAPEVPKQDEKPADSGSGSKE